MSNKSNVRTESQHIDNGGLSFTTYVQSDVPTLEVELQRYESNMKSTVFFHNVKDIDNLISVLEDLREHINSKGRDVVY